MKNAPPNYLTPEVRLGENVDLRRKKLFKVSIEILEEIKRICSKYSLRYFAEGGTLLGAVRHKGFIPWDDDMDLLMPRRDYIEFLKVAPKELPAHYFLQTIETDRDYRLPFAKIRDCRTTMLVAGDEWAIRRGSKMCMGIWVSIFPLDGRPDSDWDSQRFFIKTWALEKWINFAHNRLGAGFSAGFLHVVAMIGLLFIGEKRIINKLNRLFLTRTLENSRKCAEMHSLAGYHWTNCASENFKTALEVPFEYTTIAIPIGWEDVLCTSYGKDWRTPIKGAADHEVVVLEPDVPYREYVYQHYGRQM